MIRNPGMKSNEAIAILRVSTKKQVDGVSLQAQEEAIKEHCRRRGLKLIAIYKIAESARKSELRLKYKAIRDEALKKGIGHLVFYMNDREARNLTDNEENETLFLSGKMSIHYARENKVYDETSSDSDLFIRDIHAVTNKQFSRNLSAKVNDAMTKKAENGWFPNNHAPLGYKHHHPKDEFGRTMKRSTVIIADPNQPMVVLVQREFELRAQNFSYDAIHESNIRDGFVPVVIIKKYSRSSIEKRLKNPFYRGEFRWKGKLYKGKHPLIIPQEVLRAVDATIGLKSAYGRRVNASEALFAGGWLKCGDAECGCQITYDPKYKRNFKTDAVKKFDYYHCSNGKKVHDRQVNVSEDKLWTQFEAALDAIAVPERFAKKIAEALNETHRAACDATKAKMAQCRDRLEAVDSKKDQLFDFFTANQIDREEFEHQVSRLKENRREVMMQLEAYQLQINGAYLETARTIIELATSAKELWKQRSPIERRQMLDLLLSNRSLDGATVRFNLKKPFVILAEMARKENWRPQGDSNPCILREREVS